MFGARLVLSLSLVASLAAGCFGDDGSLFGSGEPLLDDYTGSRREIRGDYALGSPVTFRANLEEDETGAVDIEVHEGFEVLSRAARSVETRAATESTGTVAIFVDGDELGRFDTRIAPVGRVAFRRAFDLTDREDYTETLLFHPSATVEVVVDFYAADDTRLFGRGITTVPDGSGASVVTTDNNDRVVLGADADGVYDIPVLVNGEELGTVSFEMVGSVDTLDLELQTDGSARRVVANATAGGRRVIVAPMWFVDGVRRETLAPLESLALDGEAHEVEAQLDELSATLFVPAR